MRSAGAMVAVMANDETSLEETQLVLGREHAMFFGDISVAVDVQSAIEQTIKQYGKIDVIHNNAGIAHPAAPLHEAADEEWKQLFDINLMSILFTIRFGLEALKKQQAVL